MVRKTRTGRQRARARFAANGAVIQPSPGIHAACKPCSKSSEHGKRRACLVACGCAVVVSFGNGKKGQRKRQWLRTGLHEIVSLRERKNQKRHVVALRATTKKARQAECNQHRNQGQSQW